MVTATLNNEFFESATASSQPELLVSAALHLMSHYSTQASERGACLKLASVIERFHLLKYGLAIILTFVGLKMLAEHWIHVPILISLGVILGVLAIAIIASLIWPAPPPPRTEEIETTGSIFGGQPTRERRKSRT